MITIDWHLVCAGITIFWLGFWWRSFLWCAQCYASDCNASIWQGFLYSAYSHWGDFWHRVLRKEGEFHVDDNWWFNR